MLDLIKSFSVSFDAAKCRLIYLYESDFSTLDVRAIGRWRTSTRRHQGAYMAASGRLPRVKSLAKRVCLQIRILSHAVWLETNTQIILRVYRHSSLVTNMNMCSFADDSTINEILCLW
jgi:hypothetical protein